MDRAGLEPTTRRPSTNRSTHLSYLSFPVQVGEAVLVGVQGRIRTCVLQITSLMLSQAELLVRVRLIGRGTGEMSYLAPEVKSSDNRSVYKQLYILAPFPNHG